MNQSKLVPHTFGLIGLLCIQFLLGIWANFQVSFPDTTDIAKLWQFAVHSPVIMAHMIFGTLLVLGGLVLVVRAYHTPGRVWKTGSGIGFGSVLLAWLSGEQFVSSQQNVYSLAMALFFLVAIVAYFTTIYLTKTTATSS